MRHAFNRIVWLWHVVKANYQHPVVGTKGYLDLLTRMAEVVEQAANTEHPRMFEIGMIDADTGEKHVVLTVWVGIGDNTPMNRLGELAKELALYKQIRGEG